jgi:hypothetical protein
MITKALFLTIMTFTETTIEPRRLAGMVINADRATGRTRVPTAEKVIQIDVEGHAACGTQDIGDVTLWPDR